MVFVPLALLLAACVAGLLWGYSVPAEKTISDEYYHYRHKAELDYTVQMLANGVFSEESLNPGSVYITELTDYITVNFQYNFSGEQIADIKGSYRITAELIALMAQDREDQLLWQKSFDLIPRQSFAASDREIVLQETFIVPFAEYRELTGQISDEIKISPAALNLVIKCDLNLAAETGGDVIRENLAPTMKIPLKGNTFTVDGNLAEEAEGSLVKASIEPVALVIMARTTLPWAALLIALTLVVFLILTIPADRKVSPREREVYRILKMHKDQVIKTAGKLPLIPEKTVEVESIDDLMRLADEVGKPVLYTELIDELKRDHCFMVFTAELVFLYQIAGNPVSLAVTGRKERARLLRDTSTSSFIGIFFAFFVLIIAFSVLAIAYACYM
jgi:hypothetical protein